MTKPAKPSTAEPHQPAPGDDEIPASLHLQQNLPAIARVVVALALQGNVSAASLCFRVSDPHASLHALLERGMKRLTDDDMEELALILADAGYLTPAGLLTSPQSALCGTITEER